MTEPGYSYAATPRPAPAPRRRSAADVGLATEAFALIAFSAAAIRLLPFRTVGRLASGRLGRRRVIAPAQAAWAVRAAARRSPWRAVCFQQGLAAQIMLRRRGIDSTLYFGAAPGGAKGLSAHVWVKAGEVDVVGCEEAAGFAVLARFPGELATKTPARFDG